MVWQASLLGDQASGLARGGWPFLLASGGSAILWSRYWHTVRHLRLVQIYGRVWFRLHGPRVDASAAPGVRAAMGAWVAPAARSASMVGPSTFRLLNETREVTTAAGWNDASADKLWLYNLHYFDDLNAEAAAERAGWHRALIERWIADNPPGRGNGWEPYPVSLRIVNWVKWGLTGNRLQPGWVQSLAVQARWLAGRLEWQLLGNHLLVNAKALVFAGAWFQGAEAERWLRRGLRILEREVPEQVLPDGAHFERSPMYHALVLEDLLDLINLAGAFPGLIPQGTAEGWREAVQRMRGWLAGMLHPDGEIGFFNDAAMGVAPRRAALEAYAERLGLPAVTLLPGPGLSRYGDSGYVRLELGPALALLDVAPVGPDYLPGHAHADTLSFELSLFGRRVVVNGGTSRYGVGPERLRERSTAAHSTLELDGESRARSGADSGWPVGPGPSGWRWKRTTETWWSPAPTTVTAGSRGGRCTDAPGDWGHVGSE